MLLFSMKQWPARIYVCTVARNIVDISADDESSEQEEEEEALDADDNDGRAIVSQRAYLTDDEKNRLSELPPVGPYVGLLYVTRLTTTNLRRYDMVSVYFSLHIFLINSK